MHVVKQHAAHGKAMRFARGVWGHTPQNIFLKWCNLVRFGVYLDQILSLKITIFYIKNSKIPFFYIKISKITIFYLKNKYFRYTLAMW